MSITGLTYLFIFIPILVLLYYNPIIKNKGFKNVLLLLASLAFYALIEPVMVVLLLAVILINYFGVKLFLKTNTRVIKIAVVVFDLLLLFFFKYINMVLEQYNILLHEGAEFTKIAMPLGISYYTFNAISYVEDASNSKTSGKLLDTALYISFFAKMSSGPIVQYNNMIGEINNRTESFDLVCTGFKRFAQGLIKKVLIADAISNVVALCFEDIGSLSVVGAWIGSICYTLQIYFDFSGCTDMAIGIGNVLGFSLSENFDYPYTAVSISDFWKRWHISLTKWFTKYIYIPLGGSRVSKGRHIFNMAVVWLFTGMWHGASFTFVFWGLVYFVVLTLEKYTSLKDYMEKHRLIGHTYTLFIVNILWTVFRADSFADAIKYIGIMFGIGAKGVIDADARKMFSDIVIVFVVAIIFSLPIRDWLTKKFNKYCIAIDIIFDVCTVVLGLIALCVCITMGANGSVALYANF